MRIGINAQLLSFSQGYRNGGVSRYIRYLLSGLSQQPGEHEYVVFINGDEVAARLPVHSQITYVTAPWPEEKPSRRVLWEQLTLPSLLRQHEIEVFHSPVNVLPELLPKSCASVITLHDLAFLRFPHVLTRAKRLYHRTFTVRSIQRSTMLITVSNSTREDAHTLAGVPLERIRTVYPCIDTRFVLQEDNVIESDFRAIHHLEDGFILYLGTLEPRKNIPTLIEAYALLRQKYGRKEKLVLAGGKGWLYETIFAKVRALGLESEVVFPGFVEDDEQTLWYSSASAFVYPSLYEGFGIPVAEALACGVPVVTSNISSLPEAGAQVALCVDPTDIGALCEALAKSLTDQQFREKSYTMAPAISQRFSARIMTEQTVVVYEEAAALFRGQTQTKERSRVVQ